MSSHPPKPKVQKGKRPSSITPKQHRTAQAIARVLMRLPVKK